MNILLDTHALLWLLEGDESLSENAKKAIQNPENTCFLSTASYWEITIKVSLGKLEIKMKFNDLPDMLWENGIELLNIEFEHYKELMKQPYHHKDPFDRLIIAQGISEKMHIISCDENFPKYDIKLIW